RRSSISCRRHPCSRREPVRASQESWRETIRRTRRFFRARAGHAFALRTLRYRASACLPDQHPRLPAHTLFSFLSCRAKSRHLCFCFQRQAISQLRRASLEMTSCDFDSLKEFGSWHLQTERTFSGSFRFPETFSPQSGEEVTYEKSLFHSTFRRMDY